MDLGQRARGVDLYGLLGVPADASQDDLSRAYRRRARDIHPDMHPEDPAAAQRFRDLTAAYDELSDEARRAAYDRTRPPDLRPSIEISAAARRVRTHSHRRSDPPLHAGPVHVDPPLSTASAYGGAPPVLGPRPFAVPLWPVFDDADGWRAAFFGPYLEGQR